MKQGLCFRCHQARHVSRECAQTRTNGSRSIQNMNTPPVAFSFSSSTTSNHSPPAYTKAANAYARIKTMYKELPDNEKSKLTDNLESMGF